MGTCTKATSGSSSTIGTARRDPIVEPWIVSVLDKSIFMVSFHHQFGSASGSNIRSNMLFTLQLLVIMASNG